MALLSHFLLFKQTLIRFDLVDPSWLFLMAGWPLLMATVAGRLVHMHLMLIMLYINL